MSAYIVHDDTIDLLVSAIASYKVRYYWDGEKTYPDADALANVLPDTASSRLIQSDQSDAFAAILRTQNSASVNARYCENNAPDAYTFRAVSPDIYDALDVLASVACLEYQSCETDTWSDTHAAAILRALERAAIRHLPRYDQAAWGWTREHHAAKVAETRAKVSAMMGK